MHTHYLLVCTTLVLSSAIAAPSWPPNPNWQAYVLATGAARLNPVRVVSTAGNVTNAAGLVSTGAGSTVLTWTGTGTAPAILLDYGKEVSGTIVLTVAATSGRLFAPVLIRAAFSETQQFMTSSGDWGSSEDVHVESTGDIRTFTVYGGFRYQLLQFQNAGTVTLTAVGIEPKFENAGASKYQGWFLCSDDQLNKIWFSGAYTAQTNTLPVNVKFNATPWLMDGGKRDRALWSGDLATAGRTLMLSLGTVGTPYVLGSLTAFGSNQAPDGSMPGNVGFFGPLSFYYSVAYSMYYTLAVADYYRHTGDSAFVSSQYAAFAQQLAYDETQLDTATQLIVTQPFGGFFGTGTGWDWNFYDGNKLGLISSFNILYYRTLTEAAYVATNLGKTADAQRWQSQAAALRTRINNTFFDSQRGVYQLAVSDYSSNGIVRPARSVPQDANAQAVLWGVTDSQMSSTRAQLP